MLKLLKLISHRGGPTVQDVKDISRRVEQELEQISDSKLVSRIQELLVTPYPVERAWDYFSNSWRAQGKRSPFAPCAERIAYIIFTGPRSSFMVWNAGVFFLVVSQWPSEYSRINCTVKKLPRMTLES
jgi:hypothetical protein